MGNRTINPEVIKAQIALLLHQYPELMNDEEARVISLESETEVGESADQILNRIQEIEAMVTGLGAWMDELKGRMSSFRRRIEGYRKVLMTYMEIAEVKRLERPLGTLTIGPKAPHVIITDEKVIPQDLWRYPDPEPNKILIREMLKNGDAVPGAVLSNRELTLTIRI
jgi:hypothetical protein